MHFSQGGENEVAECQRGHKCCRKFVVVGFVMSV